MLGFRDLLSVLSARAARTEDAQCLQMDHAELRDSAVGGEKGDFGADQAEMS